MAEETLFQQASMVRHFTLKAAESITEETADVILPGFTNNIRWHLGHIYMTQEWLMFYYGHEQANIPPDFNEMFAPGTKPADWKTQPPSLETLRALLSEQTSRIKTTFAGRLSETTKKPFELGSYAVIDKLDDMLVFTLHHETQHCGYLCAMNRAIAGIK